MKLDQFINLFAEKGISLQNKNGSMPAGHNGPYFHRETPVRNTGHWIIIFAKSYKLTGDSKYLYAIEKAADFIIGKEGRPFGGNFLHRIEGGDDSNGLIGPAWSFEALAKASNVLSDSKYINIAEDVYRKHLFDNKKSVWHRLSAKSITGRIDQTFNHQLWFAATSTLIHQKPDAIIFPRVELFLNNLKNILLQLDNGLIYHAIYRKLDYRSKLSLILKTLNNCLYLITGDYKLQNREIKNINSLIDKSIGYHSFNLYAFAMLKLKTPNHPFWNSSQFREMLNLVLDDKYFRQLQIENHYGLPYNVPGFEIPFIAYVFDSFNKDELILFSEKLINFQLKFLFNKKSFWLDRNNTDPATLSARFYELTRLPDYIIREISVKI